MWFIDYIIGMDKIIKELDDTINAVYKNMSAAEGRPEKCKWSKIADRLVVVSTELHAKRTELLKMVRV